MTPDLFPQSCFDPHMDFPEIGFDFRVVNARQWRQISGNKPEKGLLIIISLRFSVLWSLVVSMIQISNNNV